MWNLAFVLAGFHEVCPVEVPLTNSLLSTIWTIPTPPSLVTPTNVMRVGCVLFQGTDEDIRQHRARDKRAPLVTGTEWITNDCPLNLMILTAFTPHAARLSRLERPNLNTKLLLWGDHVKRLTKIQNRGHPLLSPLSTDPLTVHHRGWSGWSDMIYPC